MVIWVNDGLLQAYSSKMLVNDGEMLGNDGEMSIWPYTHFTILDEHFTIINEQLTIIHSFDHRWEAALTVETKTKEVPFFYFTFEILVAINTQ